MRAHRDPLAVTARHTRAGADDRAAAARVDATYHRINAQRAKDGLGPVHPVPQPQVWSGEGLRREIARLAAEVARAEAAAERAVWAREVKATRSRAERARRALRKFVAQVERSLERVGRAGEAVAELHTQDGGTP